MTVRRYMHNYRCRLLHLLFILLLSAAMMTPSFASESSDQDDYDGYRWLIYDEEDLLTDEEESILYDHIDPLLDYCNVFFSTVWLSSDIDYEAYAEDFYYDVFGNEPGVHFQIDMGNRKLTLSASTDMEDLIGHERESIVDNIYKTASGGDYCGCASECFDEILTVLQDGQIAHTMKHIDNAILALLLALILNFFAVFILGRKKRSDRALVSDAFQKVSFSDTAVIKGKLTKIYSPQSKSSGGSGSSSGGGGGGGGFSGGSSSHGF